MRALRLATEHNPVVRPEDAAKLAYYNIRPDFNVYQVQGTWAGGPFMRAYGEKYLNWMAPMKTMVDAGVHVVFSQDLHLSDDKVPVESQSMVFPDAWKGTVWGFVQFLIDRKMPLQGTGRGTLPVYNPSEGLDRVSAMKSATIWPAEKLLNEKNIGSLEVGKLADFIAIDKDYFGVPVDQIYTIKTLLTVVGGKTTYKDSAF